MEELLFALREDWGAEGALDFLDAALENGSLPDGDET